MKKTVVICSLLVILILIASCGDKDKNKLPDGLGEVTEYAPIPSIKSALIVLQQQGVTFSKPEHQTQTLPQNPDSLAAAFAWGVNIAQAQLAVQAEDIASLRKAAEYISDLAPAVAGSEIATVIENDLKPMLRNPDWQSLSTTFYSLQSRVEQNFFDERKYAVSTVAGLGSWTRVSRYVAELADSNPIDSLLMSLSEAAGWETISANLALLRKDMPKEADLLRGSEESVTSLIKLLKSTTTKGLSQEERKQLVTLTENLAVQFYTRSTEGKP